jgi:glycosyltransferase involved in cell wall biosynthesis
MPFNILIDTTCITQKKAGVGIYAKNLIRHLLSSHSDVHLYLLVHDDDPDFNYSGHPDVTMISVPAKLFRRVALRFLLEQLFLPFLLAKHRIHVLHSLHYSFPLLHPGVKQVVTLHDMTSFKMPEVHLPLKVIYFHVFIRAAVRYADKLIFVSNSAQQDCAAMFHLREQASTVIHLGKADTFTPSLGSSDHVRHKYNLPPIFLLYIGTIEPRKNLVRLVSAFASISNLHKDCVLVIAGMKGWMYDDLFKKVHDLNIESRVIFTGFVSEEDKLDLIQAATVFVYPSLYEGFGVPVLEAMACGIPTITSNISSLPEIAGNAALLVDPTSEDEIAAALNRLLSNPDLRRELSKKSILQAALFTWDKTATLTMNTYRSLVPTSNLINPTKHL